MALFWPRTTTMRSARDRRAAMDAGARGDQATGLPPWAAAAPGTRAARHDPSRDDVVLRSKRADRLKIVGWDGSRRGPFWNMA
jgi:hypothetical protein